MKHNDFSNFAATITALLSTFGKEADEPTIQGYWMGLDDIEFGVFEAAVKTALRENRRFAPTPGELRALAAPPGPSPEDRAALQWPEVMGALGSAGGSRPVTFEDPCTHAAVRALGWDYLCEQTSDNLNTWEQKKFIVLYVGYANNGVPAGVPESLLGRHGDERSAPVLVSALLPQVRQITEGGQR